MLLIVTSTGNVLLVLLTLVILDDIQPKNRGVLVNFCDFWLLTSELRQNGWTYTKITCQQKLLFAFHEHYLRFLVFNALS